MEKYSAFPLSKIIVDRESRQRRKVEQASVTELAQSFAEIGQIQPIVIRRDGRLVAGETRFLAAQKLNWETINVTFTDEMDPKTLHLIELEENIRRTELPWNDRVIALERFHNLMQERKPEWTQADTGKVVGLKNAEVSEQLAVATEILSGNERVKQADKLSQAKTITKRDRDRRGSETLAKIKAPVTKQEQEKPKAPILHADFSTWAPVYDDEPFTFIHCDFPYGINAQNQQQGNAKLEHGTYADSPEVYWNLMGVLEAAMENVVADRAHLMFWFAMDFYQETFDALTKMGWRVNPYPLVWQKSDNKGLLPDAKRGPRRIYETAFFASRGDLLISHSVSNAFACPTERELHMSQKPQAMLKHFFKMFVDDTTSILDPTCGSGSAVQAAHDLGADRCLGLEREEEFFNRATSAWKGE